MRELLIAFVIALILGSILNGMQQNPNTPNQATNSAAAGQAGNNTSADKSNTSTNTTNTSNRDFPDFASFANVDGANFNQVVLKSKRPVFVDCYVPNNQACDQMLPLVAAVGKKYEQSITMARMNVMDNIVLAHRYEIGNVPTFLLFDQGTLIGKLSGVLPQDRLESLIANLNHGEQ